MGSESRETSGLIGGLSAEQAEKLRVIIKEKTELARSLRASWTQKFEEFKRLREEHAREQATIERLMLNESLQGKMKLTREDVAVANREAMERIEASGRDAKKYLDDARALESEVEELTMRLENRGN